MNPMKNDAFLESLKEAVLLKEGYELQAAKGQIKIIKQAGEVTEGVFFKYDTAFLVQGLTFFKRFPSVERFFIEIMGGDPEQFNTLVRVHPEKIQLNSPDEVRKFVQDSLPVLAEFPTLKEVNNWLSATPFEQHPELIGNNGNTVTMRELVILRLEGNARYKELYARFRSMLCLKAAEGQSPYVKMYKVFQKLEKDLKEMAP
ncbi:hypothetical protein GFS24_21925 [Chitinophaga sp. SYP-B3965]|uniref:hypothetical protein n=1 Tax=Chitinophaga sp. SYP-B3965 TaxID=2663120 RepID=UPI0012998C6C|nr:hypothetical protein [Chitinophaga sp. SYP-B3965]MRG47798.1 hypothetical protein [Chitinophaga sp. SYP-B3965]